MSEEIVIIGDGNAGASAAEEIRKLDSDVDITVVTDESEPLYNRIMLKNFMKGTLPKQYTKVHDEAWYESRDIELHLDTRVVDVDTENELVESESGNVFSYDKLLVATGGSPRVLPQDEGFDNVYYMWTMDDAERVQESAEESDKAVVVGGGLLGIDLAMAYAEHDCDTFYLIKDDTWWSRGLDEEGAEIIHRKMREKGIEVVNNTRVDSLDSENGSVQSVISEDGEEFECDSVAVAIGQTPNSDFLDSVEKNEQGMVKADGFLQTSIDNIFAAGNMVDYWSPVFEHRTVKGSWDHSEAMGRAAGRNMVKEPEEFDFVNTYGVGHFDVQFLAIGDWNGEPVSRKYSENEYRRLFFNGDRLVGAVMIGYTKGQEELKRIIQDKEKIESRERLLDKDYWS